MGSHSVTCHPTQVNAPRLTNPIQNSWYSINVEGWKAELTLVAGSMPEWFTHPQTVTHASIINRVRHRVNYLDQDQRATAKPGHHRAVSLKTYLCA